MKSHSISIVASLAFCGPLAASTFTVTTAEDQLDTPSSVGGISLREAIRDAGTSTATICFGPNLAGAEIVLESPIYDTHAGGRITIDGSDPVAAPRIVAVGELSGSRLFGQSKRDLSLKHVILDGKNQIQTGVLATGVTLLLEEVEVRNFTNAAISVQSNGSVEAEHCYFHHNSRSLYLSSLFNGNVSESLFCFNQSDCIYGGTNENTRLLRITNSTFAENSGNTAAVRIEGDGPNINLIHCSFVDNNMPGLRCPTSSRLTGNLFARNIPLHGDGSPVSIVELGSYGATSDGYNLVDDNPAALDQETDHHASDVIGDGRVLVSRLGDYGGKLMSCFPLRRCRAIDGGDGKRASVQVGSDMRGFQRKGQTLTNGLTNIVDIGAVEVNPEGTLEVTNTFTSGAGSLRNTLLAATGETVHIIFNTPITSKTITHSTTYVLDEERNYNFDASFNVMTFKSGDSEQAIFQIGDGFGGETSVSFQDVSFQDFDAIGAGLPRGCIEVLSDGLLNLHDCSFKNNTSAVDGAIDVFRGKIFANECLFEGNSQIWIVGTPAEGGAAIHVDGGLLTIWNSTFTENKVEQSGMSGGAIRMEGSSRATFKQCTFHRNEARANGGALHSEDSGLATITPIIFDRCTFVNNGAINGAISLEQRMKLEVSNCLFSGNINNNDPTLQPDRRDLYAKTPGSVTLVSPYPNWTDSPQAFPGLVPNENLSSTHKLAPLKLWGGQIPTTPLIRSSAAAFAASTTIDKILYPRDAQNEVGYQLLANPSRLFPTPGAIQQMVDETDFVNISIAGKFGTDFRVRIQSTALTWQVETSTDLENFTANGQTVRPLFGFLTVNVPIPQPEPDQFFVRFVVVPD